MAKSPVKKPVPPKPAPGAVTSQLKNQVPAVQMGTGQGMIGREVTLPSGVKIKVKNQVTRAVIPQLDNVPIFVTITGAIFKGEKILTGKSKDMDPADLAPVINIGSANQELGVIIVGAVLKGELERGFPDESYVGRSFGISTAPKETGQRFRKCTVWEIEVAA